MIDICSETTQFSFVATYYQVMKSGHDMKNEAMRKNSPRVGEAMKNKQLRFLTGRQRQPQTQSGRGSSSLILPFQTLSG